MREPPSPAFGLATTKLTGAGVVGVVRAALVIDLAEEALDAAALLVFVCAGEGLL